MSDHETRKIHDRDTGKIRLGPLRHRLLATEKRQQDGKSKAPECKGAQVIILRLEGKTTSKHIDKALKAGYPGFEETLCPPKTTSLNLNAPKQGCETFSSPPCRPWWYAAPHRSLFT